MSVQRYAANTNNAFYLNDTALIAQALLEGSSPVQVVRQATNGLLDYRSISSRETYAREILKRLAGLEPELLGFLTAGGELRRVTNLYTFLRSGRLLREFFLEVLQDKRQRFDRVLRPTDVGAFFTRKLDQEPLIASWSEATLLKARSNILKVLTDARVLEPASGSSNLEIMPVFVPSPLRSLLERVERFEELAWFS